MILYSLVFLMASGAAHGTPPGQFYSHLSCLNEIKRLGLLAEARFSCEGRFASCSRADSSDAGPLASIGPGTVVRFPGTRPTAGGAGTSGTYVVSESRIEFVYVPRHLPGTPEPEEARMDALDARARSALGNLAHVGVATLHQRIAAEDNAPAGRNARVARYREMIEKCGRVDNPLVRERIQDIKILLGIEGGPGEGPPLPSGGKHRPGAGAPAGS